MPSGDGATVRSLERDSQPCAIARAGDNVAVCLQGIDASNVIAGGVLCHPNFPVAVATHLELKVLVLDIKTPILMGSQVLIIYDDVMNEKVTFNSYYYYLNWKCGSWNFISTMQRRLQ